MIISFGAKPNIHPSIILVIIVGNMLDEDITHPFFMNLYESESIFLELYKFSQGSQHHRVVSTEFSCSFSLLSSEMERLSAQLVCTLCNVVLFSTSNQIARLYCE